VITAFLTGDEEALARLRAIPDVINAGLARAIAKLGFDLQQKVQQDELSGQVLSARSGALRSSIGVEIEQGPQRITARIFSDSDYAAAHEFGFSGEVNVRASLRQIREAFGRPIAEKMIAVRAHSRTMLLPERSFLRSALEQMGPEIRDEVDAALHEALTE
jgi:phage gpG-like protein